MTALQFKFQTVACFLAVTLSSFAAPVITGNVSVSLVTDNSIAAGLSTAGTYSAQVVGNDLINTGQPTLSSAGWDKAPLILEADAVNDGVGLPAAGPARGNYLTATAFAARMPFAYTVTLDTSRNIEGYELTTMRTFAGYAHNGACLANQKFEMKVSYVGSSDFISLGEFTYVPFDNASTGHAAASMVTIQNDTNPGTTPFATGVDQIQIIFKDHGFSSPAGSQATDGTVISEIDVIGTAIPVPFGIATPTDRTIIQRNAENTADIPITGFYVGSAPDRIEARAVLLTDSGTTVTDWQIIDNAPSGGTFSGTLQNVPAGGWYQLQARTIVGGTQEAIVNSRLKVGVGDIYITAGQSNSVNSGQPLKTDTNDRVSVRSSLENNLWQHAIDPLPIGNGTGGSVWTRLGDLYVDSENIPVGFMTVGWGSTSTAQWLPSANLYYPRIRSAVQSFPANGFKAILWHQGENDSYYGVNAATYQANLEAIIAESRTDAGWDVPWYVAEAAYAGANGTARWKEAPINAGQRNVIYADPLTFIGPRTDDFWLEAKLHDSVHFNAAGLLDHATQWNNILTGNTTLEIKNGDFETYSNLADGGNYSAQALIGFQQLAASGLNIRDGGGGYWNPSDIGGTYPGANDTINGGVLPNMAGKHVAFLYGGSAGNNFLQTLRTNAEPNTTYTLSVAIGRRLGSAVFSRVKIEILVNGQTAGTPLTVSENDATSGAFTDFSVSYTAPDDQAPNQPLSIRITKLDGGSNAYTDFDNIRLTQSLTPYGLWQQTYFGSVTSPQARTNADEDLDFIPNRIEYFMGTSPTVKNASPLPTVGASNGNFTIPLDPAVTDQGFDIEYSLDLNSWYSVTTPGHGGVTNQRTANSWSVDVPSTLSPRSFFRLIAEDIQ